jgi:hypothetical protein
MTEPPQRRPSPTSLSGDPIEIIDTDLWCLLPGLIGFDISVANDWDSVRPSPIAGLGRKTASLPSWPDPLRAVCTFNAPRRRFSKLDPPLVRRGVVAICSTKLVRLLCLPDLRPPGLGCGRLSIFLKVMMHRISSPAKTAGCSKRTKKWRFDGIVDWPCRVAGAVTEHPYKFGTATYSAEGWPQEFDPHWQGKEERVWVQEILRADTTHSDLSRHDVSSHTWKDMVRRGFRTPQAIENSSIVVKDRLRRRCWL